MQNFYKGTVLKAATSKTVEEVKIGTQYLQNI